MAITAVEPQPTESEETTPTWESQFGSPATAAGLQWHPQSEETDAGLQWQPQPEETDAGLQWQPQPEETDADLQWQPQPEEADAGLQCASPIATRLEQHSRPTRAGNRRPPSPPRRMRPWSSHSPRRPTR